MDVLLQDYLTGIVSLSLDTDETAIEQACRATAESDFDVVKSFCQDEQQLILYIRKNIDESVSILSEVSFSGGCAGAVLIKKKRAPLHELSSIASQTVFSVINSSFSASIPKDLSGGNTFIDDEESKDKENLGGFESNTPKANSMNALTTMYKYISLGFAPMLRSCSHDLVNKSLPESIQNDSKKLLPAIQNSEDDRVQVINEVPEALKQSLPMIMKRLNELDFAMRSCLETMEIPEVKLQIDPIVEDIVGQRQSLGKPLSVKMLGTMEELENMPDLRDHKILNRLQAGVSRWIKEIQSVTRLEHDADSDTVANEVQFWLNLDRALRQIQLQVEGLKVNLTLEILKRAQRSLAVMLFSQDTGLKEAILKVSNYRLLMAEFPIGALLSAADVKQIEEAIMKIFSHMKKVKSAQKYPLLQAVRLVETLSRDMAIHLKKILLSDRIMAISFSEFEVIFNQCNSLFSTWNSQENGFHDLIRDLSKRRGSERLPPRAKYGHVAIAERLIEIQIFRSQHEKFRTVLTDVFRHRHDVYFPGVDSASSVRNTSDIIESQTSEYRLENRLESTSTSSDIPLVEEVNRGYDIFRSMDTLDVSREGTSEWERAKIFYDRHIDSIERLIIERLTDKLGSAETSFEMFRIFHNFNPLFFRPRIRSAIQQFQSRLISSVEKDIENLQNIFKRTYTQSQASTMSEMRDVPPISGAILWAKQIEHQLDIYFARVEDVLGSGWEQHLESRRLQDTRAAFKSKLNTQHMFENWLSLLQSSKSYEVNGRLFHIEETGSSIFVLRVNFDRQIVELFKEVRYLQWLGFRMPYTLKIIADEAKMKYPIAVSLQDSLDMYCTVLDSLAEDSMALLESSVSAVQECIEYCFARRNSIGWEGANELLQDYCWKLSQLVYSFQDRVEITQTRLASVDKILVEMQKCPYDFSTFRNLIDSLQKLVDEMNLSSYTNLNEWVTRLEARIEKILTERLKSETQEWIDVFNGSDINEEKMSRYGLSAYHEIALHKNSLNLSPPLEVARSTWFASLHKVFAIVCNLSRIQSSRYDSLAVLPLETKLLQRNEDIGVKAEDEDDHDDATLKSISKSKVTFSNLFRTLAVLPKSDSVEEKTKDILSTAYLSIEERMDDVHRYVNTWLQYQALWDMEPSQVFNSVGNNFGLWQRLIMDIQNARGTFETAQNTRSIGAATINFQQIQAQVSLKYDAWQQEILSRFIIILEESMRSFHSQISTLREELESVSFDGAASESVKFVTLVKRLDSEKDEMMTKLDLHVSSERLAQRQHAKFPIGWIWSSNLQGEWEVFSQILERKTKELEARLTNMHNKIVVEDKVIEGRILALCKEWNESKPKSGSLTPQDALNKLSLFEGRVRRIGDDFARLQSAKQVLDLVEIRSSTHNVLKEKLDSTESEIGSFKEVWTSLSGVSVDVEGLRATVWTAVAPKTLRSALDDLVETLRKIPARVQQYEIFDYMYKQAQSYQKSHTIIVEMHSGSIKDRHWHAIEKILGISHVDSTELTLGDLWDRDLVKHQHALGEVFRCAQGEMGLEAFLHQVRDFWSGLEFDLVNYQNRCRIIRGWDDLFAMLDEHSQGLVNMKQSPYFHVFEDEAISWETKLARVRVVLDTWIDVQRRWIYLGGIFLESVDIKQQLPNEHARFVAVDNEFIGLMRKTSQSRGILDIMAKVPSLDRLLSRVVDHLENIQRTLGEYLERQRKDFPRFYFVGDDDLLEIIGNKKDPMKTLRHMNKMFAGIFSLGFNESATAIESMISREGEVVSLVPNVVKIQNKQTSQWLKDLEVAMKATLRSLLKSAVSSIPTSEDVRISTAFMDWIDRFPAQIAVLAMQLWWCKSMEEALSEGTMNRVAERAAFSDLLISALADRVLAGGLDVITRKKCEQLITELVHQREVIRQLSTSKSALSTSCFEWMKQLRCYWNDSGDVCVSIATASFTYGFEYQGIGERLVQTPLTNRCYLAMSQALHFRLGGNPFGPAGTGKTESVKALGSQLGRFVLVFNCDEHFDLAAMGRIFVGLCQVGAWGCFDEFNRLEERILSAVSQQILTIQKGLMDKEKSILMMKKSVNLNADVGIFVTMNPGYAGRRNLPDNLKQLFRSVAMIEPDRRLIGQVLLFAQGFNFAEILSSKVVLLFELCKGQLSEQPHYGFGLRSVKSVLMNAGNLKRAYQDEVASGEKSQSQGSGLQRIEETLIIRSICDTLVPKLVKDDVLLFKTLLDGVFPGAQLSFLDFECLRTAIRRVCRSWCITAGENWLLKTLQLYQVLQSRHGVIMVGPSATGKTTSWRVLLEALEMVDGVKGQSYVIDPKAMSKESLFGSLDSNTLEWSDGVFTHIIRTVLNNMRGEKNRRHWIILDGDVDPEWAENLNSVLDDNRLLTLPNGERLAIPDNLQILFEVDTLRYATQATVSRCGMIWYSEDTLSTEDIIQKCLTALARNDYVSELVGTKVSLDSKTAVDVPQEEKYSSEDEDEADSSREQCCDLLRPFFQKNEVVQEMLEQSLSLTHLMEVKRMQLLTSFFSLLARGVSLVQDYNQNHLEYPMEHHHMQQFLSKWLIFSILWGFGGSLDGPSRQKLALTLGKRTTVDLPDGVPSKECLWSFSVSVKEAEWIPWRDHVVTVDIEPQKVMDTSVVINTVDTVRHDEVIHAWLNDRKPVILCGPPGSGKTMTLLSVLKSIPNIQVASLNFSSETTPSLIVKTLEQYCVYRPTQSGFVLSPPQVDDWLVLFCDEVNLPVEDAYGTQRVITLMRQIVEHKGFWRPKDFQWIAVERVQFVCACNPPTDPGRVPLTLRFLRHSPLLYIDYPADESLRQIYGTLNRATLKLHPTLRSYSAALTEAIVDVYVSNKERFLPEMSPHYIYSPRELSRWVRALFETLSDADSVSPIDLERLWYHEGLRLFHDRLVHPDEREWCSVNFEKIAMKHFPASNHDIALAKPVLFATWLCKGYTSVEQEELRDHVQSRLRTFYEEELNVPLVVFDDVLEHVLRIDRVLSQPLGHVLLVGMSGAGKTVLSRFVAWMNGLKVFQIKLSKKYSLEDFEHDLREMMKAAGCQNEKVCFIFDESNILEPAFLERMNALLASGEVPGLFEGDEYNALISACRDLPSSSGGGGLSASDRYDEAGLFQEFTRAVQRNLHVVFTMNPASSDLKNRAATSPALFNRCVVDWFGDWSRQALCQVAYEFTRSLDTDIGLSSSKYLTPSFEAEQIMRSVRNEGERCNPSDQMDVSDCLCYSDAVVSCLVSIHESVKEAAQKASRRHENHTFVSPRDYLDLIHHFAKLYKSKRSDLEDQQLHLNVGLEKLQETADQVEDLRKCLAVKRLELEQKGAEASMKLHQMVNDQNEAEKKKLDAENLSKVLGQRNSLVAVQKQEAERELGAAEPALVEAQRAVSNIKKANLVEMQSLSNPPEGVKMTLEAVCLMLGWNISGGWSDIRRILQRRDFIPDVVNFQSEHITMETRHALERMLENPNFVEEKVMHANKACLSLYRWVVSQLRYASILRKIQPLRDEVAALSDECFRLKEEHELEVKKISELELQIGKLKNEYAALIGEAEVIKTEINTVTAKVERSTSLLRSLTEENERWKSARINFAAQMRTLAGDALLGAAFITYCGFYDHSQRQRFLSEWSNILGKFGVKCKSNLSLVEYMSRPSDRLSWQAHNLPNDDLSRENAIILDNYERFPLVIDPSGQADDFLMNHFASRKVSKTSFLDSSFMKQLESALRFGTCLVITDVENIDPILNPVLNREIQRSGGRILVRLGDRDIDFSPTFSMFLTTRDATFQFPPDVCSRVTFVNFTVTPASLHSQCLSKILKAERADIDQQREDILKLQGEYQARLRYLEERLLDSLNAVEGNILDDDSVLNTLESLKREALDVSKKASQASEIVEKVESVSRFYMPFASMCSNAFFAMECLSQVHFTYQFNLGFFFNIFDEVLRVYASESTLDRIDMYRQRLQELQKVLFFRTFHDVKQSLLDEDKILWAIILMNIYLKASSDDTVSVPVPKDLVDKDGLEALWLPSLARKDLPSKVSTTVSDEIVKCAGETFCSDSLETVSKLEMWTMCKIGESLTDPLRVQEWCKWIGSTEPEDSEPPESKRWNVRAENRFLIKLHLLKIFRGDRLIFGLKRFVDIVFGSKFVDGDSEIDLELANIIEKANPRHPVLLSSSKGFDMSGQVDFMAVSKGIRCRSVAMGSSEGFLEAERSITSASHSGGWVLLKNVHLTSEWLSTVEKMMFKLSAHNEFRLIMTSELSARMPQTLLKRCVKLMHEAPSGIRASLLRSLQAIHPERMNSPPVERSRMYFLLAWFHAILLERLRFIPMGWSKPYEFNDSDQLCAMNMIDEWMDSISSNGSREHVAPEKIPWTAVRSMLVESIYGGRIDNDFDHKILNQIALEVFTPEAFSRTFYLVQPVLTLSNEKTPGVLAPKGTCKEDFHDWVTNLAPENDPSWLGLSLNADKLLLKKNATTLWTKHFRLREQAALHTSSELENYDLDHQESGKPKWMLSLNASINHWMSRLNVGGKPNLSGELIHRGAEFLADPVFRCFQRESETMSKLVEHTSSCFNDLIQMIRGDKRMTDDLISLAHVLHEKRIPATWESILRFGNKAVSIDAWIDDLATKSSSFSALMKDGPTKLCELPIDYSLRNFFSPNAFVVAVRQKVAHNSGAALEDLHLAACTRGEAIELFEREDFVSEVILEGGTEQAREDLLLSFSWVNSESSLRNAVELPLYSDSSRDRLLAKVYYVGSVGENHTLRGVALIAHIF